MRHFTESVNTRFEVGMIKLLDEVVESEWCQRQGMNRSDLVRHLVRIGIKNFHDNQPKNRELKN
jgi:metal-responsive CopG/Arc/MetJ family transcriptional regulator